MFILFLRRCIKLRPWNPATHGEFTFSEAYVSSWRSMLLPLNLFSVSLLISLNVIPFKILQKQYMICISYCVKTKKQKCLWDSLPHSLELVLCKQLVEINPVHSHLDKYENMTNIYFSVFLLTWVSQFWYETCHIFPELGGNIYMYIHTTLCQIKVNKL